MSVCIAAVAEANRVIVLGFDRMASLMGGALSMDEAITKSRVVVNRRWSVMFAGDDITRVPPVLDRIRADLWETGDTLDINAVATSVSRAYQAERTQLAVETHLSVYQMDMPQFLANGDDVFQNAVGIYRERIEQVALGFDLLCFGFDASDQPHIFVVEHPGTVKYFTRFGYWAIGSGALSALGRLSVRRHTAYAPLKTALYNVCEAKIASESAAGVGRQTELVIARPNQSTQVVPFAHIDKLRERIRRNISPKVSAKLCDELHAGIKTLQG